MGRFECLVRLASQDCNGEHAASVARPELMFGARVFCPTGLDAEAFYA